MRVVITRPRGQAERFAELIEAHGAEPIFFPTIRITPAQDPDPLDTALQNLSRFDWVIFTSAQAVQAVWVRLEQLDIAFPTMVQVAAIGPKTTSSLEARAVEPNFVPQEYISEAIVPGLGNLAGQRVLLPLADLAEGNLPEAIGAAGGDPVAVIAYHTLPASPDPEGLAALNAGVDAVTFTSGSTARNFVQLISEAGLDPIHLPGDPLIACIGPKTAAVAASLGFRVDRVAETYTTDGLVAILLEAVDV